jgi:hypothetical protein
LHTPELRFGKDVPVQHVEIRIKGQINQNWSDWMSGLSIKYTAQGETILTGSVRDQSVLYGLLDRLNDLGIQLNSVTSTGLDPA